MLPSACRCAADAAACCASKGYQNDKSCPSPTPAVVVNAVCYDYDKTLQKMKDILKNSTDYMAKYSDAGTVRPPWQGILQGFLSVGVQHCKYSGFRRGIPALCGPGKRAWLGTWEMHVHACSILKSTCNPGLTCLACVSVQLKAIGVYGEEQMIDLIAGKSTAV